MMAYSILIYIFIALACNASYFFACHGEYPECGSISMIFVNISILCQFLPKISNIHKEEKNQKNGQYLICTTYLIIEILLASIFILNDKSFVTSGTIQIVLLCMFLITYFGMARANLNSNTSLETARNIRSSSLLEACANLRIAISICQNPMQRDILREIYAELNSIPSISNMNLEQIDKDILTKVTDLCSEPTGHLKKELSQLINRRKTIQMVISQ